MGTTLKVALLASAAAVAGVLVALGTKYNAAELDEPGLQPYIQKKLKPASTEEYVPASKNRTGSHNIENMKILDQYPELPTGCEVTSLTMVLNYNGYGADKLEISRNYLEKSEMNRDEDDILYGPDFRYIFPGDPEEGSSFGCLAPCIVNAAGKYIADNDSLMTPVDLTGTSFYELFSFIDHDVPVMIWGTLDMVEPEYICTWKTPKGEEVKWPTNEHCMVLSAYNYDDNTVQLHDPIKGVVTFNMDDVKKRYDQIGQNAVVIINKKNK